MADQDEQTVSSGESDAETKLILRLFETDRASAMAQLRQLMSERKPAGSVLDHLNRLGHPNIVAAIADIVVFDATTPELVVIEYARGLARTGQVAGAEQILERMSASRRNSYAFQLSAGRVLADARRHKQALKYFEAAFRSKPTAQAAERIFLSHLMLEQYQDAAAAMGRILRAGSFRAPLGKDFVFLLQHIKPGELDPELAFALAAVQGTDEAIGPVLVPHLVACELMDCVLAAIDRDVARFGGWDEAALLSAVPYLAKHGRIDYLLRLNERYGETSPAVGESFARAFADIPPEKMPQFLSPEMAGFVEQKNSGAEARAYLAAAEKFLISTDVEDALDMLRLLPKAIRNEDAERFYAREKHALARLAALIAARLGHRSDAVEALAQFIVFSADAATKQFFAGADFEELTAAIAAARRLQTAPDGSRLARLREDYFGFYLERRRDLLLDSLTNDFHLCGAALEYFASLAGQRPAAAIPVGAALAARLRRPALSLGVGKPLDVLASFAVSQDRPAFHLAEPDAYDEFCWWYLTKLAEPRRIPPDCLQPEIIAYLNEIVSSAAPPGLSVTRFLMLNWSKSDVYRRKFDLSNFIDRFHFLAGLVASLLSRNTQYLLLFLPFLVHDGDAPPSLANLVIDGLTRRGRPGVSTDRRHATLSAAASGTVPGQQHIRDAKAPRDVLLIGHASKDTGLGRNFGMLAKALTTEGIVLTGLDFDASADTVCAELTRWYQRSRSHPVVIFAVNAHDVPDFLAKDRNAILFDCYTIGFFLWEVSRVPAVQRLGVALVDEIWAPTKYVADVYAAFARTHVIGKGLFDGDEGFPARDKTSSVHSAFTFVTVFDFDSSIERKNPLAVVRAFQDAFKSDEKVALIVKASSVNPQHWSNAARHWERLLEACAGDRRITLVTERYSAADMTALVRDADCIVSLHRSEGFGYLISDAMAFATPVIATDYSGNVDFCNSETAFPVSCRLVPVPPGAARWRCEGAEWADADVAAAALQMRAVFEKRGEAAVIAQRARREILRKYSVDAFRKTILARIEEIGTRSG